MDGNLEGFTILKEFVVVELKGGGGGGYWNLKDYGMFILNHCPTHTENTLYVCMNHSVSGTESAHSFTSKEILHV